MPARILFSTRFSKWKRSSLSSSRSIRPRPSSLRIPFTTVSYSAVRRIIATAPANRSQFCRSASSCFRPVLVSE